MQDWLLTVGRWFFKKQMTRLMKGCHRRASFTFYCKRLPSLRNREHNVAFLNASNVQMAGWKDEFREATPLARIIGCLPITRQKKGKTDKRHKHPLSRREAAPKSFSQSADPATNVRSASCEESYPTGTVDGEIKQGPPLIGRNRT